MADAAGKEVNMARKNSRQGDRGPVRLIYILIVLICLVALFFSVRHFIKLRALREKETQTSADLPVCITILPPPV